MPRRIELRTPSLRRESEFLAAAVRSRAFHRPWGRAPTTSRQFREWVRRHRGPTHRGWFLVERSSGALVGVVNLMEIVRGPFRGAFLGYYVFLPHARNGYMREGLRLVLDRAFGELALHRVEANIQPTNRASLRLVRGLGFRREGYSPRYLLIGGRWCDHERWALLAEEWRSARLRRRRSGRPAAPRGRSRART